LAENGVLENQLRERWISYLQDFINQKYQMKHNTIDEVVPEMKNILDAIDWCRNNGRHEAVLQFLSKIDFYLWTSGNWNLRHNYLYCGLEAGTAINNDLAQANFCRRLADICDMQGDREQSMKLASMSLVLFERCGDEYGMFLALFRLAAVYHKQYKFRLAKDMAHKALAIAQKFGDKKTLMWAEGRLGTIYLEEGDYQPAKVHVTNAVLLEQSLDEYQRKAWSSPWLYRLAGRLSLSENDYAKAEENLNYSLSLANSINNPQEIAETTSRLAELYFSQGQVDKAVKTAVSAIELFSLLGMKWDLERTQKLLNSIATGSLIARGIE
jgi:tetratricopeptide (TPR) repeat protein